MVTACSRLNLESMLSNMTKKRVQEGSSNRLLIFLGKLASKPGKQQKSLENFNPYRKPEVKVCLKINS